MRASLNRPFLRNGEATRRSDILAVDKQASADRRRPDPQMSSFSDQGKRDKREHSERRKPMFHVH